MTDMLRIDDPMDPARGRALQATLGREPTVRTGDQLPPFFHQVHFWEVLPPRDLGPDGHPRLGGLIPDLGLPRRMWAGGRIAVHTPLRAGIVAEKTSRVDSIVRKTGRTGPLAIVTLRHEITQGGKAALTEWQDIVYRAAPDGADPPVAPRMARTDEEDSVPQDFDTTLLFRYSALTFIAHRIHFDDPYARRTGGYDGLVVHGALLAQMLMLFAEDRLGPLAGMRYRAVSALMQHERAQLCRAGRAVWVRAPDGRLCLDAEATPA